MGKWGCVSAGRMGGGTPLAVGLGVLVLVAHREERNKGLWAENVSIDRHACEQNERKNLKIVCKSKKLRA